MNLRIRYEGQFQKVDVELSDMEGWLNIEVSEESTIAEREKVVQEKFNDMFNKPEYNNLRQVKRYCVKDREADAENHKDGKRKSAVVLSSYREAKERARVCDLVRELLPKKPEWADAVIAVYIDGCSIREYAEYIGESENNITQKLKRARNKLKKIFQNRQILPL